MADNAPKQNPHDPPLETIFNSSIDDDWGEAFEAEDFLAAPKDDVNDSSEFFLPESPTIGPGTVGIPHPDVGTSPSATAAAGQTPAPRPGLSSRFSGLSLPLKIALVATPFALGAVFFLFIHKPSAPQPSTKKADSHAKPTVAVEHTAPPAIQPTPHEAEHPSPAETTAPSQEEKAPHPTAKPEEKEIRKKWRFPAVIVQAKTENGQDPTILSTDLTLVLKLPLETMPPSAKDAFVREMIYQFYTNQPLENLRRFALERGEMTRKLQSWIVKQWPGLPLDSVTVDRYQLL